MKDVLVVAALVLFAALSTVSIVAADLWVRSGKWK